MLGIEAKMQQRVVMCAGFEDYVAAMPAVASAGTAARHKLLAPKRETAVATVAGFHGNDYFINEQGSSRERPRNVGSILGRDDVDELAHASTVAELHRARNSGEERIVFA